VVLVDHLSSIKWVNLWNRLKTKKLQTDRSWRLLRIVHEIGDASKCVSYGEYYGKEGYRSELEKALADTLAMLYMMALNEGFNLLHLEFVATHELENAIEKRLPK
jgi:hypothetical protein